MIAFLLFISFPVFGDEITGRVAAITDGDTLKILTPAQEQIKIRLAGIDAPEHDQPYGSRAKQALSDLAYGKTVSIEDEGQGSEPHPSPSNGAPAVHPKTAA